MSTGRAAAPPARVRGGASAVAVLALVAVNLVPLVGVISFGWSLFGVLLLYWLESGVIGVYNLPRILLARGSLGGGSPQGSTRAPLARRLGLAGFFLVHYGAFWVAHFFLLLVAFGPDLAPAEEAADANPYAFPLTVMLLFVSHGVSFALNYLGRGEYRTARPSLQMWAPYGRVFTFHLATLGGGVLAARWGSPLWMLVALVVLKTLIDAGTHLWAHALHAAGGRPEGGLRAA